MQTMGVFLLHRCRRLRRAKRSFQHPPSRSSAGLSRKTMRTKERLLPKMVVRLQAEQVKPKSKRQLRPPDWRQYRAKPHSSMEALLHLLDFKRAVPRSAPLLQPLHQQRVVNQHWLSLHGWMPLSFQRSRFLLLLAVQLETLLLSLTPCSKPAWWKAHQWRGSDFHCSDERCFRVHRHVSTHPRQRIGLLAPETTQVRVPQGWDRRPPLAYGREPEQRLPLLVEKMAG